MAEPVSRHPYETACPRLDRDHQVLASIIGRLEALLQGNPAPAKLRGLAIELAAYLDAHFESEEQLMESTHFPDLAQHRDEHDKMLDECRDVVNQCGHDPDAARATLDLLWAWVATHIDKTDRIFGEHLKAHMPEPPGERWHVDPDPKS